MNKQLTFKAMHQEPELLFLPNAWDVISAMILEQSGFKAIGTTSWGIANALGYTDGEKIEFSELLSLVAKIVSAVNIPVTVDIESGYGLNNQSIAQNVLQLAKLGVAGINIEDSFKNAPGLVDTQHQCDVLTAIRQALDLEGYNDFFINARIDTYFQLSDPLNETISRAAAYVNSGADGIFVPGLSQSDEIKQLVNTIDAPINLLSLPDLADSNKLNELGVKRFSIGNGLSDAVTAFIEAQSHHMLTHKTTENLYTKDPIRTIFR